MKKLTVLKTAVAMAILLAANNPQDVNVETCEFELESNTAGPPVVSINTVYAPLFCGYTETEIDLMAAVVYYEAGGQDMLGKQLVADTILNRVDSIWFPNSIEEVINQSGQFTTAKKARKLAGNAPIDCYGAVISQLERRENYEVMYFGKKYGSGEKMFKHGGHCFSGISKRLKEKEKKYEEL